jgi:glycosyltransferase involved in cell wall biosynthesis
MKKRYKIAMVAACPFPTTQGSQVFIRQLTEALLDRGHEVHLVTYHFGENTETRGLTIHRIPEIIPYRKFRAGPAWRKPFLDMLLAIKLLQVVKKQKIEIIHAHNYEAAMAGFIVRFVTSVPVLFHTHGVMGDELHTYFKNRFFRFIAKKAAVLLDIFVSRFSDRIIAISSETRSFFDSGVCGCSKVEYIPPGISYPELKAEDKIMVRETHKLGNVPLILYTGNLDHYQNLELLIKSFRLVVKNSPLARLVFLTHCETGYHESLCAEEGIAENVVFIKDSGFNLLQSLLEESDIAVLPRTSWSGFPIKLLNYMAAGKAVVACESSSKCIEHMLDGLKVKDGDLEGFACAIIHLIGDVRLRMQLGSNAATKVQNSYSWDRISIQIDALYAKMTGQGDRRKYVFCDAKKNG